MDAHIHGPWKYVGCGSNSQEKIALIRNPNLLAVVQYHLFFSIAKIPTDFFVFPSIYYSVSTLLAPSSPRAVSSLAGRGGCREARRKAKGACGSVHHGSALGVAVAGKWKYIGESSAFGMGCGSLPVDAPPASRLTELV